MLADVAREAQPLIEPPFGSTPRTRKSRGLGSAQSGPREPRGGLNRGLRIVEMVNGIQFGVCVPSSRVPAFRTSGAEIMELPVDGGKNTGNRAGGVDGVLDRGRVVGRAVPRRVVRG